MWVRAGSEARKIGISLSVYERYMYHTCSFFASLFSRLLVAFFGIFLRDTIHYYYYSVILGIILSFFETQDIHASHILFRIFVLNVLRDTIHTCFTLLFRFLFVLRDIF